MATDPRKMRPGELCRLLNSTPLGEVINEQQLRRHRNRAGMRIGDGKHVDLVRYVAWLVQLRHAPKSKSDDSPDWDLVREEVAEGAAGLGRERQRQTHGQNLTDKQEALLAALLTEPTLKAAAAKAGVGRTTAYRWMQQPAFRAAYQQGRREIVDTAIGRGQAACGLAIDVLMNVAQRGRRDSDRVRAAVAMLDHALRGLSDADILYGEPLPEETSALDTAGVVKLLSVRLQQLDKAAFAHCPEIPAYGNAGGRVATSH